MPSATRLPAALAAPSASRASIPTRFAVPRRPPCYLPRPSLEDRIRAGARQRLLLITGPAGQGKTVTTAEALRHLGTLAWVTLDPSDADPAVLWDDVLTSLGLATGLSIPGQPGGDFRQEVVAACRLLEPVSEEVTLVLDADTVGLAGVGRLLGLVLDWMPQDSHVVVIARRHPAIGLERRRTRGDVAEITAEDLAFSEPEARSYLEHVCDLPVDAPTATRLAAMAEGWPLALQLIAATVSSAPDAPRVARAGFTTDGRVTRAFVRELLGELDEADRDFLLDVAVLDELTPAVCDRVSEQEDGAQRLARLADRGLIVADERGDQAYRHRAALRSVLLEELHTRMPGRERDRHAVAATCSAERRMWLEAIGHAVAAGDVQRSLDWLEDHLDDLIAVEGGGWLGRTFGELPAVEVASRARLLAVWIDLGLVLGDRDLLERMLVRVEDPALQVAGRDAARRRVRADLARLRGDGVEPLLVGRRRPGLDPIVAYPLGVALAAEGRHDAATAALRCALDDARLTDAHLRELVILGDLAWQRAIAGHLVEADLLCRRATDVATAHGLVAPPSVSLARAQIALDRGRTDVAREHAAAVRLAAMQRFDLSLRTDLATFVSRARWVRGDVEGAVRALDELDRDLAGHTPGGGLVGRIARARASLRLALDDVDAALEVMPAIVGAVEDLPPEDRLIAAQIHLKRGDPTRAQRLVEGLGDAGVGARLTILAARLDAVASAQLGQAPRSALARRRADRIARATGLLATTMHQATAPRFTQPFLESDAVARGGHAAAGEAQVEVLTPRELAVLRMLPSSSNGEIATELYVSVNTVKTHLKNIYRKLGVASREEAVQRSRVLGSSSGVGHPG